MKITMEQFYQKYYNAALLYTFSLTRNYPLAEDITHDAFFKAMQSISDKTVSVKAWYFAICRNEYLNYLKKKKPLPLCEDYYSQRENLLEKLIRKEEYRSLYAAIDMLKDVQREVVLLYYFEGASVKEISAISGLSISNVKIALFRAREKLKKILEV